MKIVDHATLDLTLQQPGKTGYAIFSGCGESAYSDYPYPEAAIPVSLSSEIRYPQYLVAVARPEEPSRAEKLQRLKEQIARGTYRVDASEVAKAIIRDAFARRLVKRFTKTDHSDSE